MDPKVVLITGGSRGIGAEIAKRAAKSGFDIWLNYLANQEAAGKVQSAIEALGQKCTLLPFDISDEKQVDKSLASLLEKQVPYAFIHNAGVTKDVLLAMMQRQEWDDVLNVNLTGFFLVARLVVKHMISARQGRIIAITSVSGEAGQAGQVNYCASKAGLIGAVKSLAREVARRNILVNAVSPGLIATEMSEKAPLDKIIPLIPLNRVGQASEVAAVVNFLLSEEASYITGQVIGVNGGLHM
jgi:3-oxoacyl-[acyl-carrier protein] reductase